MPASKKKAVRLVAMEGAEKSSVVSASESPASDKQARAPMGPYLRITLVKSGIGYKDDQKRTLAALGLKRLNMTVERPDNPSVRGMVNKVQHLVQVEEIGQA